MSECTCKVPMSSLREPQRLQTSSDTHESEVRSDPSCHKREATAMFIKIRSLFTSHLSQHDSRSLPVRFAFREL